MGLEAFARRRLPAVPGQRLVHTSAGPVRVREQRSPGRPAFVLGVDTPNVVEHYDGLLAALEGRADVVILEPPGTGGSLPRRFPFTLAALAQVVRDAQAALGLEHAVLVLPCYLGLVGELLEGRVVRVQTPTREDMERWVERVDPRGLLRTPVVGQVAVRLAEQRIVRGWYGASAGSPAHALRLADTARTALRAGACYCLASLMQGLGGAPPEPLPRARAGITAWGDADRTHRRSRPYPGPVKVFPGCGHSPELEAPAAFARWLLDWEASNG